MKLKRFTFQDLVSKTPNIRGIPTNEYKEQGRFPVIDQGNKFIAGYSDNERALYKDTLPVVVFGDHTLSIKYLDFPFCVGADGTQLLKPNTDVIIGKFLYYAIINLNIQSLGYSRHFKVLKKSIFYIPDVEEQHRIVKILDLAQSLIEKRKQAIAYLDDYIKAVFLDMFGDPVSNPKGWEVVKFEDICKIETEQISPIKIKSSHYYIGLEDIEKGTGRIIKTSSSNSALLKSAKFVFTKENVLYGKLRPYLNKVALPEREGICSTDILPLTPIKDKSQKHFICYLIRSDYFVSQMIKCTVGANLPRVNSGSLNETSVYSPPIALQGQFSEIVQKTESLQQKMQSQLQELEHNFQAQLQRAFRGE